MLVTPYKDSSLCTTQLWCESQGVASCFLQIYPLSGHIYRPRICFDSKYTVALNEKEQYIDTRDEDILDMANTKLNTMTLHLHSDTEVGLLLKQIRTFGRMDRKKWAKAEHFPLVRHWSRSLPSKSPYLSWEAERRGRGTNGKGQRAKQTEKQRQQHMERREEGAGESNSRDWRWMRWDNYKERGRLKG